ncbi:MAG: hypothetical protein FRX49_07178 [Trebouxia sp. A1-2]|nr:MAG: hypothetical protein FRX49_07178 [Trebouxia sp. A1-2]
MWKQACKNLPLRSSRQLSFDNFRWSGQQSLVTPAVFSVLLQPASVLQTPALLLASRCLHQQAGSEQIDLNYRSVSHRADLASFTKATERLSKIRVSVGKALKARHVPKLEFRLNQLSESQAAVEQELDRLKAGLD